MENSISTLALLAFGAAGGGVAAKLLKLPMVIGFIAAGIILSSLGFSGMQFMGQIGVMFLLFVAGVELPVAELKKVGWGVFGAVIVQILLTFSITFGMLRILGYTGALPMVLGLALAFGSTIVVVKTLSEKSDLQSLYGKVTVGYLLIQDFLAVLVLALLGISTGTQGMAIGLILVLVKFALVLGFSFIAGKLFLNKLFDFMASWPELLSIASVGWCLVVAALASSRGVGLGYEIGGFIAGLSLANVVGKAQIAAKTKTLRDFFLMWFFLALGSRIGGNLSQINWLLAILFIFIVIAVNPWGMMLGLGRQKFGRRIVFWGSLGTIALSEFSLIILDRSAALGIINGGLLATVALVMAISLVVYGYVMNQSEKLYLKWKLVWHSKKKNNVITPDKSIDWQIVIFGHNRVGSKIRPLIEKQNKKVLVVDFNPTVIEKLKSEGINAVYGDMADQEIYEELGLTEAELVISTVPDKNDSLLLLEQLHLWKRKPFMILTADDSETAEQLYEKGADFVLVPHAVGADYLGHLLGRGFEAMRNEAKNLRDLKAKI